MTAVETLERDQQRANKAADKAADKTPIGPIVCLEYKLPPPLTAPAIVKSSRKRP